jgi:hypothetical protein
MATGRIIEVGSKALDLFHSHIGLRRFPRFATRPDREKGVSGDTKGSGQWRWNSNLFEKGAPAKYGDATSQPAEHTGRLANIAK